MLGVINGPDSRIGSGSCLRGSLSSFDLYGYPILSGLRTEIVDYLLDGASASNPLHVLTINPEIALTLKNGLAGAVPDPMPDVCIADGVGIVWAARVAAGRRIERYPGIELAVDVMRQLADRGGSVYLLGSSPGVAEQAAGRLTQQMGGIKIAGFRDGYFTAAEEAGVVANIFDVKPDLLLVGMGSPLQEGFISANKYRLGVPLMIGVGGSFDVLSGQKSRAPRAWQLLGLEWLYRVVREPARAARLVAMPRFAGMLVYERVRQLK